MLKVSHKIKIGSAIFTSGDSTRLVDLQVKASLDVPVNGCRIVLSPPDKLSVAPEDPVSVELGYEDDLALVFTGTVGSVEWDIDRANIYAKGAFQSLLASSFNLLYEKSKAGDIVSDVISRLGLSSGKVESGIEFPAYALGENQTVYQHLHTLARQCGFDLYADAEDKVVFAKYSPSKTHEFQYGVNILAFTSEEPTMSVTGVEVYGESPSSLGQGSDAYAWLTKQQVQGTAGDSSGIVKRVFDPTVRTLETATQIAKAALSAEVQKRRGTMRVLGTPAVKLGDAVKVSKMPVAAQNGSFKVRGIGQVLSVRKGFFTAIAWEEA